MRKKKVVISREAVSDIEEGQAFYDGVEHGLGQYFFNCIFSDLESLRFFGGIHALHSGFHRMLSKRFPFAIYYDVKGDLLIVAAVLDMRRNPSKTQEKLGERSLK